MNKGSCLFGLVAILCLGVGCIQTVDNEEPPSRAARGAQIDNGNLGWLRYTITFEESEVLFADLLVIGDTQLDDYRADREYWFVATSHLDLLGDEGLLISMDYGLTDPPVLSGDQEFTQAVFQTWNRFTSDPVSGGYLYDSGDHHLRVGVTSGEISRLTWYQTIPANGTPENLELSSDADVGSGSVTVPSGHDGFYVDAVIN